MIKSKIIYLISCILFIPSLSSATLSDIFGIRECEKYLSNNCRQETQFLKDIVNQCKIKYAANQCDQYINDPEYKGKIINCNSKELCLDLARPSYENGLSCLKGAWQNVTEAKDLLISLWDLTATTYKKVSSYSLQEAKSDLTSIKEKIKNVSAEELPSAVKKELAAAWEATAETLKNNYQGFQCLNTQGMSELRCRLMAPPAKTIQHISKKSFKEKTTQKSDERRHHDLESENRLTTKVDAARAEFTNAYLHYSPTTEFMNRSWMSIADINFRREKSHFNFFDVENSKLKKLNDEIKDKDFVTSLTNKHKQILFENINELMDELKKKYPDVKVFPYSDFKASRIAIRGVPEEELQKKLDEIFVKTNAEFVEYVKKNNLVRAEDQPETWFRAGFGQNAEQASLATRFSRSQESNQVQMFSSGTVVKHFNSALEKAEDSRKKLSAKLSQTEVFNPKTKTLDADAFDILRKNKNDLNQARKILLNRFELKEQDLDLNTVSEMQNYISHIDSMMPAIHVAKREVATLVDADKGGISADIVGLGAKNYEATAKAMAASTDLEDALKKIRAEEKLVTIAFEKQKQYYQKVVEAVAGSSRIKSICTGDDCISIPSEALSRKEKTMIMNSISNSEYSSKYRNAFVSDQVKKPEHRTEMVTHGESIEKLLRGHLSDKFDHKKLQGITFGLDMKGRELGQGLVDLIVGKKSDIKLTPQELSEIRRGFQKAIEEMNTDLKSKNKTGKYFTY